MRQRGCYTGRTAAPKVGASAAREGAVDVLQSIPGVQFEDAGAGKRSSRAGKPLHAGNASLIGVEHHDEMPCHMTTGTAAQPVATERAAAAGA